MLSPNMIEADDYPHARETALSPRAQEILHSAIELFNRDGVSRSSTNRIADALGMSSGNLHYHFRSKGDIILASYRLIERDICAAMRMGSIEISPQRAFDIQYHLFETLWRYRFFFGSMEVVLTESPIVFDYYSQFQRWVLQRIEEMLDRSVKLGLRQPIRAPNTRALVAANSWMLWTGWIRWELIAAKNLGAAQSSKDIILRVIRRHLSFQEPYYSEDFAERLSTVISDFERSSESAGS